MAKIWEIYKNGYLFETGFGNREEAIEWIVEYCGLIPDAYLVCPRADIEDDADEFGAEADRHYDARKDRLANA